MIPTFELGPLTFPAYFTLLTVGFMLAIWLAWREAPGVGVDQNQLLDVALIALVMGLVGARLLHVVADGYWDDYVNLCLDPFAIEGKRLAHGWKCPTDFVCQVYGRGELCDTGTGLCHPGRDCLRAFKLWYGGLAYYGGFLAAFGAALWFVWRRKMPIWRVGDLTGFGIALGLVFGRLGCFFAGCCFGDVCHTFPGLAFPRGGPAWKAHTDAAYYFKEFVHRFLPDSHSMTGLADTVTLTRAAQASLPVHPTQLYSVITNAAVFAICYWMFKKRRTYDGKVFWWFILLYSITRSIVEFWRADDRGIWWGGISTSQLISVPLTALALYMMWRGRRSLKASAPPAAPPAA